MKVFLITLLTFPLLLHSEQKTAVNAALPGYDLSDKKPRQFVLPNKLAEASGLAMTDDGRLFCHDDERAVVYQIDYSNGAVVKQFSLGRFGVRGDFEDIAVVGRLFYLVESNGTIYEFPEAGNGQTVEFRTYTTPLTTKNDVEGLEYDPETHSLLLACKEFPGKGYEGHRAVYSFSLKTKQLLPAPRFLIPLKNIRGKEFKPSGIARHPKTGTFFIIAARGSTIIEISKEGKILSQQPINRKVNTHPEGIAFAPDLTLILCNDGQGKRGTLILYPKKQ
ncbi:MAG: SdiA-regulated domain-containing protein [Bacteroidetes bacterium]|nr:SdiA-regulated domain-containing protein [Bacteroidota bacterium]MCW5894702.1 SdiA-regulated domain-containing protein [Bacteroidota bacterium]